MGERRFLLVFFSFSFLFVGEFSFFFLCGCSRTAGREAGIVYRVASCGVVSSCCPLPSLPFRAPQGGGWEKRAGRKPQGNAVKQPLFGFMRARRDDHVDDGDNEEATALCCCCCVRPPLEENEQNELTLFCKQCWPRFATPFEILGLLLLLLLLLLPFVSAFFFSFSW